jgi:hypothetical protein
MTNLNIKDTISTICGVVFAICVALMAVPNLPVIVTQIAAGGMAVSGAIIGILTGKNPNGTTKTIDPATGQQDISVKP